MIIVEISNFFVEASIVVVKDCQLSIVWCIINDDLSMRTKTSGSDWRARMRDSEKVKCMCVCVVCVWCVCLQE